MLTTFLALALTSGGRFTTLPATELVAYVDDLDADWIASFGTSASGLGLGDGTFGSSKKESDMQALVASSGDIVSQSVLAPIIAGWPISTTAKVWGAKKYSFFSGLSNLANQTGLATSLDGLMTYFNVGGGGPWTCLAPPEWVSAYSAVTGANPSPLNVYAPVAQGSTYTVGLGEYNVATTTFTAPTPSVGFLNSSGAIDTTKYAGGFPVIQWTGGAGSGACTITVAGKNQVGAAVNYTLSGTWGTAPFVASQSGVALTPSVANSLATQVTGYTVTGMTAGVMFVDATPPSGRSYPPS